jgi:hypothetical protein
MHTDLTDEDLRGIMKATARVANRTLPDERIERALPALKSFLSDIDAIRKVELAAEDEPMTLFRLRPTQK